MFLLQKEGPYCGSVSRTSSTVGLAGFSSFVMDASLSSAEKVLPCISLVTGPAVCV